MDVLTIYTILFCSLWVISFIGFMWTVKGVPQFQDEVSKLPDKMDDWPVLSIIIPACNEAVHIETALTSLLKQDYPKLEIIAINDRSIDATGEILDRLAEEDARVHVIHIQNLPKGWLGKVHAMHQGVEQAKGGWYLFTDADVHFSPGMLRRAIIYAQHHQVNHVALLPRMSVKGFWIGLAIQTFGLVFLLTSRVVLVNKPNSKTPIGVGAFNLVQAKLFQQTPGFEWLRLEPGDDYGLGMMIKNAGGRTRFAFALKDLSVPWYANVWAMFKGLEKNMFGPGGQYQLWRMLFLVFFNWGILAAPSTALIAGILTNSLVMLIAAFASISIHIIFSFFLLHENRSEIIYSLMFPIGLFLFTVMLLWSSFRCIKNNGIDWRGTHYSLEELRAGQRVKF